MATCTYDNLETLCRELWHNGQKSCAITSEVVNTSFEASYTAAHPQHRLIMLPYRWNPGQIVGDKQALPDSITNSGLCHTPVPYPQDRNQSPINSIYNDKQLLERAAKAAGITIDKSETNGGGRGNTGLDIMGNAVLDWHNFITWNPLSNDGDAFKLAVKLGIKVCYERNAPPELGLPRECAIAVLNGKYYSEVNDRDPSAAMRRATVRAAAGEL
jgi:hypothetical protein